MRLSSSEFPGDSHKNLKVKGRVLVARHMDLLRFQGRGPKDERIYYAYSWKYGQNMDRIISSAACLFLAFQEGYTSKETLACGVAV